MTWLRLDDQFAEHKRIQKLSDKAFRLHVHALCLCARKLTDGHLTSIDVKGISAMCDTTRKHHAELVDAGLWIVEADGYAIRDFLDYNPTAEEVKQKREANALRQQEYRQRRNGKRNALRNDVTNSAPSHPIHKRTVLRKKEAVDNFMCSRCDMAFKTQWRLNEHLENVHHQEAA